MCLSGTRLSDCGVVGRVLSAPTLPLLALLSMSLAGQGEPRPNPQTKS